MSVPLVQLITEHEAFASAVCEQLSGCDFTVRTLSPDEACESRRFRDCLPDIAFVDFAAETTEGFPLYQAIKTALRDCQVILICTLDQAPAAAQIARVWEVFDYVLTDAVRDPSRIPLLIERARTHSLPELSEIHGHAKLQHRQILKTLEELRSILKTKDEHPVVGLIAAHKTDQLPSSLCCDAAERRLAETYGDSILDLICGRLKRLENDIRVSGAESTHAATTSTGNCILIVEDNAICGAMAKHILERNGFDVVVAASAEEAKGALTRHSPALVLMDIHLGNSNGLYLVKALRTGHTCPDVPVVIVSSDRMQGTVHDAVDLNVQGYLVKPYPPSLLVEKVKSVLAESREEVLQGVAEGHSLES